MLTANLALWPSPPPSSELKPNSPVPSVTPIAGWFVMYRTVPDSEPEPNSVPWVPRSTSMRDMSNRSMSGVNSESEITDSSR